MRDQALMFCHQTGAYEEKNFRAASLEILRYMVASDIGITLMPRLACRAHDNICFLPFAKPKPTRTIGIIWRRTSPKKLLLEKMVGHIRRLMA